MARFFDAIGYGTPTQIRPGVWEDSITERKLYGDVKQNMKVFSQGDTVLGATSFQTTISVVADAYALENFTAIKYVRWAGSVWTVTSVGVLRPRLTLIIGEVWNGPVAETNESPDTP